MALWHRGERLSRRSVLRLAAVGSAASLLAACAPAAAPAPTAAPAKPAATTAPAAVPAASGAPVEIRMGHGFAAEEQLWLMGARPDITPNQGKAYTLKLTAFRANADRFSAFEAGQLDGGTTTEATALTAAEQGVPIKLVASVSREVVDPAWHKTTYLALKESGITSAKELKGKTVGIVDFKSGTDLHVRTAAESAGLDPNADVSYVVLPFPAMGESLRTKRIDVGAFPQPFYIQEFSKGDLVEVFNAKTGLPFDEDLILLFFRADFIQKNAAVTKAFLADFVAATKWYIDNTKEARQALIDKKFVTTPAEIYLDMQDWYRDPTAQPLPDSIAKVQDIQLRLGWQTKAVDLTALVDTSLLP